MNNLIRFKLREKEMTIREIIRTGVRLILNIARKESIIQLHIELDLIFNREHKGTRISEILLEANSKYNENIGNIFLVYKYRKNNLL